MGIVRGTAHQKAVAHAPVHVPVDVQIATERLPHVETPPLQWREPTNLEAPPPRTGFVQRWVRDLITPSSSDPNFQRRFTEGWRVRDLSTMPAQYHALAGKASSGSNGLRVGNSVLCEMPIHMAEQRKRHYENRLANQMRSADAMQTQEAAKIGKAVKMRDIESLHEIENRNSKAPGLRTPLMTDA